MDQSMIYFEGGDSSLLSKVNEINFSSRKSSVFSNFRTMRKCKIFPATRVRPSHIYFSFNQIIPLDLFFWLNFSGTIQSFRWKSFLKAQGFRFIFPKCSYSCVSLQSYGLVFAQIYDTSFLYWKRIINIFQTFTIKLRKKFWVLVK